MKNVSRATSALVALLGAAAALTATPAHAFKITPVGEFTNFYTDNVYDTTGDFKVVNRVNGQQVCAWGPAVGSSTTYDCSLDGPTGIELAPGTTRVEWQVQPLFFPPWDRNVVKFTAGPTQVVAGTGPANRFLFGTLEFENGAWSSTYTELSYFLNFLVDGVRVSEFEYSGTLVVQGTVNSPNKLPAENADFVYLRSEPQLGTLRAFELFDSPSGSNVVSVEIWGYLNSVHFDSFENVRGAGFVDPGLSLEPTPVPEPATLALLGAGLAGLGFTRRRR
jgi:hypothetical protein